MTDRTPPDRPAAFRAETGGMSRLYIGALIVEALIIAALWALGRMYT